MDKAAAGVSDEFLPATLARLRVAAEAGDVAALTTLGGYLIHGEYTVTGRVLVRTDRARAIRYLRRAVALGDRDAMTVLGDALANLGAIKIVPRRTAGRRSPKRIRRPVHG